MENALPIAVFLSGRPLVRITFAALNYVPINIRWDEFYYFEYKDSYFGVVFSIDCVF